MKDLNNKEKLEESCNDVTKNIIDNTHIKKQLKKSKVLGTISNILCILPIALYFSLILKGASSSATSIDELVIRPTSFVYFNPFYILTIVIALVLSIIAIKANKNIISKLSLISVLSQITAILLTFILLILADIILTLSLYIFFEYLIIIFLVVIPLIVAIRFLLITLKKIINNKAMFFNKKNIVITIAIIIIITILYHIKNIKYRNIEYIKYDEYGDKAACLTFYNDGHYTLYDCDSESTGYHFDNESECTYTYINKTLYFDCKRKPKHYNIKVLKWNKEILKFDDNGEISIFSSK